MATNRKDILDATLQLASSVTFLLLQVLMALNRINLATCIACYTLDVFSSAAAGLDGNQQDRHSGCCTAATRQD